MIWTFTLKLVRQTCNVMDFTLQVRGKLLPFSLSRLSTCLFISSFSECKSYCSHTSISVYHYRSCKLGNNYRLPFLSSLLIAKHWNMIGLTCHFPDLVSQDCVWSSLINVQTFILLRCITWGKTCLVASSCFKPFFQVLFLICIHLGKDE